MTFAQPIEAPPPAVEETTVVESERGEAQLAWILSKTGNKAKDDRRSLLFVRFALLNLVGFALIGFAWQLGLIAQVLAADQTNLSIVIAAVFTMGLGLCGIKAWQTSRDLDQVRSMSPQKGSKAADYLSLVQGAKGEGRSMIASAMRLKLTQRISVIRHIANCLVLLGLIGTVIGFVIALSGVEPQEAGDVKAIAPMVSTMIEGMSTALYTTLVGALLNLWLLTNYQLLASGTVKLITGLVEFGEVNGRP